MKKPAMSSRCILTQTFMSNEFKDISLCDGRSIVPEEQFAQYKGESQWTIVRLPYIGGSLYYILRRAVANSTWKTNNEALDVMLEFFRT